MIIQSLVAFVILIFTLIYFLLQHNYNYWKRRGVPYEPPKSLLLGNLENYMRKSLWEFFTELRKKHPDKDYVGIYLSYKPTLVIQSPTLARNILVRDHEYFQNRFLHSGSGDPVGALNIFTVNNPLWSELRQSLSPMFTSARLRMITELMNENAKELINRIRRDHIDAKLPVNSKNLFSMYTTDTVAFSVFGLRLSALKGEPSPIWESICKPMLEWTFWRGFEFTSAFYIPLINRLLRLPFFSHTATKFIRDTFWGVVKQRKLSGKTQDGRDLVNYLIKLKTSSKWAIENPEMADDLMLAQVAIFVLGSVETSASILTNTVHELAYHPEVQEKLRQQIDEAFQTSSTPGILNYDELMKVDYMSQVIMETARKCSPLPNIDRICNKTYTMEDGLVIEEGTPVYINISGMQRDPKLHKDPEEWRPERITTISDNTNLDFTFLPFGEGPRFCIGKRYGMMQIRAALSQVIYNYELKPAVPYKMDPDPYSVILTPKNGSVVFVPRNKQC